MVFGKRIKVTITLKSGHRFSFKCDDFIIEKNKGVMYSYKAEGLDKSLGNELFYLNIENIDHIKTQKVFF